jgi:hypothetical protein
MLASSVLCQTLIVRIGLLDSCFVEEDSFPNLGLFLLVQLHYLLHCLDRKSNLANSNYFAELLHKQINLLALVKHSIIVAFPFEET